MLTLITGNPGAGKTLNTLQMIEEERTIDHPDKPGEKYERPVYYTNIKNVSLNNWHELSYDQAKNWTDYPKGTIFFIDEADEWAPQRGMKGEAPKHVHELARHRHYGIDFYVVTQQPSMVDHHLRRLVSRHIHFERPYNLGRTKRFEWQNCQADPNDKWARKDSANAVVRLNKKYFDKYTSTQLDTHKRRLPKKVYAVAGVLVAVAVLMVYVLGGLFSRDRGYLDPMASEMSETVQGDEEYRSFAAGTVFNDDDNEMTTEQFIAIREPRIADLPWSAPIYDEVYEVQSFPRPQCILRISNADCRCYTQQATPLDVSYAACRAIVDNGYFDPTLPEDGRGEPGIALTARPAPSSNELQHQRITVIGNNTSFRTANAVPSPAPVTNQPGGAYRNPNSVPTFPSAPRADGFTPN